MHLRGYIMRLLRTYLIGLYASAAGLAAFQVWTYLT